MQKSDQIQLELERLNSEAKEKENSIKEKIALASVCCEQIKGNASEFLQNKKEEIQREKQGKTDAAKAIYAEKKAKLKREIQANSGLTYSAWTALEWSSFNIETDRLKRDVTRLGSFTAKGPNGSQ